MGTVPLCSTKDEEKKGSVSMEKGKKKYGEGGKLIPRGKKRGRGRVPSPSPGGVGASLVGDTGGKVTVRRGGGKKVDPPPQRKAPPG